MVSPALNTIPHFSRTQRAVTLLIISATGFNFLCYLTIGIPLAVLPGFVQDRLGLGSVMAGVAISIQYVATLLSRPYAGRMADTAGPKTAVVWGLSACALSGVFMMGAAALEAVPWASLGVLLVGRLVLGFGESWAATGATMWGIGQVGAGRTAQVISWNGIATYGALAIGAPLGVLLDTSFGFVSIGIVVVAIGLGAVALTRLKRPTAVVPGKRMPFRTVFWRVLPHGVGLALGGVGFGALATFVTLFYASRHWPHAAFTLSVFGGFFILTRLVFARQIKLIGGFRVAIASLATECLGLVLLGVALTPPIALLGAALSGCGFALVFPALGVEAVVLVPAANRGAALGAYSVFIDVSLGVTGPVAGLIVSRYGYPTVFLTAALASAAATLLSVSLYRRSQRA